MSTEQSIIAKQPTEDNSSPFAPPNASLERPEEEVGFDTSSVFSPRGRFGRIDYLFSSVSLWLGMILASAVLGGLSAVGSPTLGTIAYMALTIPLTVLGFVFVIRRLHDMNWNGWLCILWLVPLVNLIFMLITIFMKGTIGANRYGLPRKPPSTAKTVIGLILPVIFIVGILAAVAIPAYQQYLARAQGM